MTALTSGTTSLPSFLKLLGLQRPGSFIAAYVVKLAGQYYVLLRTCKYLNSVFRQELAAREHMMDHGQLSPPTPGVLSRAPSLGEASRHPRTSSHSEGLRMSKLNSPTTSRRPSAIGGLSGGLKMTSMTTETDSRPSSVRALSDSLRMTSSQNDESALADSDSEGEPIRTRNGTSAPEAEDFSTDDEEQGPSTSPLPSPPLLLSPSEISAQLPQSLAALRRSSLVAALRGSASSISSSRPISRSNSVIQATLPILLNPACSGYFVEPVSPSVTDNSVSF